MHPRRIVSIISILVLFIGIPALLYKGLVLIAKNHENKTLRLTAPETVVMKYQCKAVNSHFHDFDYYIPKMLKEARRYWGVSLPYEFRDDQIEKAGKSLPSKEDCKCLNTDVLNYFSSHSSFGDEIGEIFTALLLLAFLTPMGWAISICLIIYFFIGLFKGFKALFNFGRAPKISRREYRSRILDELELGYAYDPHGLRMQTKALSKTFSRYKEQIEENLKMSKEL